MIIVFSTFAANEPKQHQLAAVTVITSSIPGPSSSSSSLRRSTFFNLSINTLFGLSFEINNKKNTRLSLRTPRSHRLPVRWWATLRRSRHLQQVRSFLLAVPPIAAILSTAGKGGAVSPHRDAYHLKKNQVSTVFFFEGKRFAVNCQIWIFLPVWYVLFSSCVPLKLGVA